MAWLFEYLTSVPADSYQANLGGNGPGVATQNIVNTRHYQLHLGARQAGSVSGPT